MQDMLDVLPEDSALLHAGMSRCLEMCELFLRRLVDVRYASQFAYTLWAAFKYIALFVHFAHISSFYDFQLCL